MKTEKKEGVINAENGTVPVLRISIPVKVLLDVEDEALEIFAFGMINVYGVIGRLMELMEDSHPAARLRGSGEYGLTEVIFRHNLRATEGEEYSSMTNLLQPFDIQPSIAAETIAQSLTVLGKGRRVEDDEVVGVVVLIEIFESILGVSLMAAVTGEVEVDIGTCELNGFGRAVDGVDETCPATESIDGEPTGIAEHIQNGTAVSIVLEQGPVLALVDEEPCLLTLEPVDVELQSVLNGYVILGRAVDEAVFLTEIGLEGQCRLTFIINGMKIIAHNIDKGFGNSLTTDVHPHAVSLHHGGIAIDIDYQSGEIVTLAMNEAVGGVDLRSDKL